MSRSKKKQDQSFSPAPIAEEPISDSEKSKSKAGPASLKQPDTGGQNSATSNPMSPKQNP